MQLQQGNENLIFNLLIQKLQYPLVKYESFKQDRHSIIIHLIFL